MSEVIKTFRNVRMRLYRRQSDAWIAGWMKHLAQDMAHIRLKSYMPLNQGEPMMGECYGDGNLVRFEGKVIGQMGQEVAIKVEGAMCYEPSSETIRILVEGTEGTLVDGSRELHFIMMDISPQSLGGIVEGAVTPSSKAELRLNTSEGEIRATVTIMNCRSYEAEQGYFRVGMSITSISRLDAARWWHFIQACIAA